MVSEIIEIGTGPLNQYIGTLTGYGPDCPGCSAVGNVACRTREGKIKKLTIALKNKKKYLKTDI